MPGGWKTVAIFLVVLLLLFGWRVAAIAAAGIAAGYCWMLWRAYTWHRR